MSAAAFARVRWYKMYDPDPAAHGCVEIDPTEAFHWNDEDHKFGIFWAVNDFTGRRLKANLEKITSWAVDIDLGTKADQLALIHKFLPPSFIVETKRGYQVYYDAIDATVENFETIMTEHLIPNLNGDRKAADLCRIMRVPGTYHWKDPENPFLCKAFSESNFRYKESDIIARFPKHAKRNDQRDLIARVKRDVSTTGDENLWQRVWVMDCEDALNRISGTDTMGGENVSFKRVSRGHLNILINGRGTSCFIDAEKRIGSGDGESQTMWAWVNWYQRDHKKTYEIFKKYFPEVVNGK